MASVEAAYESLKRHLANTHYTPAVDRGKILLGNTTALLPLIHFALLTFSQPLSAHICESLGYELRGLTDAKFTKGVMALLRNEFAYKSALALEQFLTTEGFAKAKLTLVNDIFAIALSKDRALERQRNRSKRKKWSQTALSKRVDAHIATQTHRRRVQTTRKRQAKRQRRAGHSPAKAKAKAKVKAKVALISSAPTERRLFDAHSDNSSTDDSESESGVDSDSANDSAEDSGGSSQREADSESQSESESLAKDYNPHGYETTDSNATMDVLNPDTNPYLGHADASSDLTLATTSSQLPAIAEESPHKIKASAKTQSPPKATEIEESQTVTQSSVPQSANSHLQSIQQTHVEIVAHLTTRLSNLEASFRQHFDSVNAKLVLIESRLKAMERTSVSAKPAAIGSAIDNAIDAVPRSVHSAVDTTAAIGGNAEGSSTPRAKAEDSTSNNATIGSPLLPCSLSSKCRSQTDSGAQMAESSGKSLTSPSPASMLQYPVSSSTSEGALLKEVSPFHEFLPRIVATGTGLRSAPPTATTSSSSVPLRPFQLATGRPVASDSSSMDRFMQSLDLQMSHADEVLRATRPMH